MPFVMALLRSTTTCSAGAASSNPSDTSVTPSAWAMRWPRARAALCSSSMSLPYTVRDTPLPVM